jgi:hypothetical protein
MKSMMKIQYIEHMGPVGERIANQSVTINVALHRVGTESSISFMLLIQHAKLDEIRALRSLCIEKRGHISGHGLFSHSNAKL